MGKVAQEWRESSEDTRNRYQEKFEALFAEYKKKMAEIEANPELKAKLDALKMEQAKKRASKVAKQAYKAKKEAGMPQRPNTAYQTFYKQKFEAEQRRLESQMGTKPKVSEVCKNLAETWNNMAEDQKEVYKRDYEAKIADHAKKLEQWQKEHDGEFDQMQAKVKRARNRVKNLKSYE